MTAKAVILQAVTIITIATVAAATANPNGASECSTGNCYYVGFFMNHVSISILEISLIIFNSDVHPVSYVAEAPGVGFCESGMVESKHSSQLLLSTDLIVHNIDQNNHGILLKTNSTHVTVIGQNAETSYSTTMDSFLALPLMDLLEKEYKYFAVSVDSTRHGHLSSFLLVGTKNISVVNIKVTQSVTINDGQIHVTINAGEEYSFIINEFQTVFIISLYDLTGTRIIANNLVSVFSGHECANVPEKVGACDHLVEQIPPTVLWGTTYYTAPLATRRSYTIKVLASHDMTNVEMWCNNTKEVYTINEGEFITKIMHQANCVIQSNRNVLVMQFGHGQLDDTSDGDPMMTIVPATSHYTNQLFLSTINVTRTYNHYATIVVLAEYFQTDKIILSTSGSNKSLQFENWIPFTVDSLTEAYYVHINLSEGVTQLTHTDSFAMMTSIVYGFIRDEGYGHPGKLLPIVLNSTGLAIRGHPNNAKATVHSTASFTCVAYGRGSLKVTWKKVGFLLPQPITINTINSSTANEIKSTLQIHNVIGYYRGYYYCIVQNSNGSVTSRKAKLTVTIPCPEIIITPEDVVIRPKKTAVFNCLVWSYSEVRYKWYDRSSYLLPTKAVASYEWWTSPNDTSYRTLLHQLKIPSVHTTDEAYYCCSATNDCGTITHCAHLEVNTIPIIIHHPSSTLLRIGSTNVIALTCKAIKVEKMKTDHIFYRWEKYNAASNQWIAFTSNSSNLTIELVSRDDEGIYHCVASNSDGRVASNNATITVYGPPQISFITNDTTACENGKMCLTCTAINDVNAIHPLSIEWYDKLSKRIESSGRVIITTKMYTNSTSMSALCIDPVESSDAGLYRCIASNHQLSYVEAQTNVVVEYAPRIITSPQTSPHTATVGDQVFLFCSAEGISTPRVQWYANGEVVNSLFPHLYPVPTVTPHVTVYTCIASNTVCSVPKSIEVNITVIIEAPKPKCPGITPPSGATVVPSGPSSAIILCPTAKFFSLTCVSGLWNPPVATVTC